MTSGFVSLLLILLTLAAAEAAPSVPIRVGGEPGRPACALRAVLNDRESDDDGLVPVRSGPARSFRALTRLPIGTQVYLCDRTGTFVGIIYGEGSCGLDEPADRRAAYRGQCESGWVPRRAADAVAESSS